MTIILAVLLIASIFTTVSMYHVMADRLRRSEERRKREQDRADAALLKRDWRGRFVRK